MSYRLNPITLHFGCSGPPRGLSRESGREPVDKSDLTSNQDHTVPKGPCTVPIWHLLRLCTGEISSLRCLCMDYYIGTWTLCEKGMVFEA